MALVELQGVRKAYRLGTREVPALRGVDLALAEGEFTVLMGPSGSGKTTLLNIVGCLDRMDAGSYRLLGDEVGGRDFNDLAEVRNRTIGFIFQAFNLIPVLDVVENIELPGIIRGDARAALRRRAVDLAVAVGLGECLHQRPDQLSGGQRQRVAIARALATEPRLILADEPTANLDSATSDQILALMTELNDSRGVTFLFSTHDPRVMRRARRILEIADGKVAERPLRAS